MALSLVLWVGLQCVIVVFPNDSHLLYDKLKQNLMSICTHIIEANHCLQPPNLGSGDKWQSKHCFYQYLICVRQSDVMSHCI